MKEHLLKKRCPNNFRVVYDRCDVERGELRLKIRQHYTGPQLQQTWVSVQKFWRNTGHSGTKSETYSRGLQYVFERNQLKLSDGELNKYTGIYQAGNGNKIEIRNEGNQLICIIRRK